jgi:hypothetical protein
MSLQKYPSKKAVVYTLNNAEDCQPAEKALEELRNFFGSLNFEIHPHQKYLTLRETMIFFQLIESRIYVDIDYLIVIIVAHGAMDNGQVSFNVCLSFFLSLSLSHSTFRSFLLQI